MGASQSLDQPVTSQVTTSKRLSTKTSDSVEYVDSQRSYKSGFHSGMISNNYQCMLIGSYGDKHSSEDVVPKKSDKPGGTFLKGVSDDLELIQELVRKDPRKNLAYVLPDVPGAQRQAAHYLSKIEELLKESTDCGVLIWYTGHGQRDAGNWCFMDAMITFDQIFDLYEKYFCGRLLTIVSDCCYSGCWVNRLAEIMDAKGIGACGHKAMEAGYMIKVFASCSSQEGAYDTYYTQKAVRLEPNSSLMLFEVKTIGSGSTSQTPIGINTTRLTCFQQEHDAPCKFPEIPSRANWKWVDLNNSEQAEKLVKRLYKMKSCKNGKRRWHLLIVYRDMINEFRALFARDNIEYSQYGYIVFHGTGEEPPEYIYHLFTKCGPRTVNFSK